MRLIGDIALDAEVRAIASGAITDGAPVLVNSNGTVSLASDVSATGTAVVFDSSTSAYPSIVYDTNADRIVISYQDGGNSYYGTAIVGTISGTSISFGSPVVFDSANSSSMDSSFDINASKVVITYGNGNPGRAIVGTVDPSDNSISFGSEATYDSTKGASGRIAYDVNAQKHLIAYYDDDDDGRAIVGTVSGTDITFGSSAEFETQDTRTPNVIYDVNAQKHLIFYALLLSGGSDTPAKVRVATISGTSVSFGTVATVSTNVVDHLAGAYDVNAQKSALVYRDQTSSTSKARVATISGTDVSFGTEAEYDDSNATNNDATYDASLQKIIFTFRDYGNSSKGSVKAGTISGTDITFGSTLVFEEGSTSYTSVIYDPDSGKNIIAFADGSDSGKGKAIVLNTFNPVSLTSENFIGFAHAAYADGQKATVKTTGSIARNIPQQGFTAASIATPVVFDSDLVDEVNVTYDTNENRVVITYHDSGNSYYGTAIVGTLSGTTISYGTPVVYNSNSSSGNAVVFDSTNNKILITYSDNTSDHTQARVGVVSGTSISFPASETTWSDNLCANVTATYDDVNDQIVIFARETNGNGVVIGGGTHSSDNQLDFSAANAFVTSISSNGAYSNGIIFIEDATGSNDRIIAAYSDTGNSSHGTVRQAYAGGGSVKPYTATGSAVVFNSANTKWVSIAKLPTVDQEGKFVIAYSDVGNSNIGEAIVGKFDKSDGSISFGTAVTFSSQTATNVKVTYDTSRDKVFISYFDGDSDGTLHIVTGTVSGTSISFADRTEMSSATSNSNAQSLSNVYIPDGNYIVTAYRDNNNGGDGTAAVYTPSIAAVDLTIGQQYFVQTDGSLDTSADDPSIIAGTAIGASDIIVKG